VLSLAFYARKTLGLFPFGMEEFIIGNFLIFQSEASERSSSNQIEMLHAIIAAYINEIDLTFFLSLPFTTRGY
jgi:hypothetical protein